MSSRLLALLRRAAPPDPHSDAELVRRWAAARDEEAFAGLVRRHGGLVWAVCRDHLPTEADAEDAFQAVWVVLARNAGRVRNPQAVAGWLHGTAVRVCRHARRAADRRRKHEQAGVTAEGQTPPDPSEWHELAAAVHAEVDRLPARERAVFVLVALEGVRQADAAERLGIKLNSLSGLLARARQRVLAGLTKKGLAPAAAIAAVTTGCHPPPALAAAATGGAAVSAAVLELARGAVGVSMRLKLTAVALTVGIGVGAAWLATAGAQQLPDGPKGATGGGPPGFPGAGASGGPGASAGGGSLSGGMSGSGGGVVPVAGPRWEHRLVLMLPGRPASDLTNFLNSQATNGWEFAGSMQFDETKDGGPMRTTYAVLRRQVPRPPAAVPGAGMPGAGGYPPGAGGGAGGTAPPGGGSDTGSGGIGGEGGVILGPIVAADPNRFTGKAVPTGGRLFVQTLADGGRYSWTAPRDLDADDVLFGFEVRYLQPADLIGLGLRGTTVHEVKGQPLLALVGKKEDVDAAFKKLKRLDDAAGGKPR